MKDKGIDVRGLSCPEPVIRTKKALDNISVGELTVLVNAKVAKENITRFARNSGCTVEVNETDTNEYILKIKKGG